jgi:hypothetical protein
MGNLAAASVVALGQLPQPDIAIFVPLDDELAALRAAQVEAALQRTLVRSTKGKLRGSGANPFRPGALTAVLGPVVRS